MHSVTKIDGIDSLSIDMKERTLTVIGDADPVCVTNLLRRKFRCAKLISAGPVPPPEKKRREKGRKEKRREERGEEGRKEGRESSSSATPNVVSSVRGTVLSSMPCLFKQARYTVATLPTSACPE